MVVLVVKKGIEDEGLRVFRKFVRFEFVIDIYGGRNVKCRTPNWMWGDNIGVRLQKERDERDRR